jgi:hypothetical protein
MDMIIHAYDLKYVLECCQDTLTAFDPENRKRTHGHWDSESLDFIDLTDADRSTVPPLFSFYLEKIDSPSATGSPIGFQLRRERSLMFRSPEWVSAAAYKISAVRELVGTSSQAYMGPFYRPKEMYELRITSSEHAVAAKTSRHLIEQLRGLNII